MSTRAEELITHLRTAKQALDAAADLAASEGITVRIVGPEIDKARTAVDIATVVCQADIDRHRHRHR
ncbi:hypothetical protein ACWDUL_21215 [Nocardia niigatensis]